MAQYLDGPQQQLRAYSPAVVTEGGRIVWMAGQIATVDGGGKDISGDFEAQTHRVFALMDQTLQRVGGTLANLVTMTVFIKEPRYGDRFVEIRKEKFADGRYPASALITVANFARPGIEIEIQGIAVIGDQDAEQGPSAEVRRPRPHAQRRETTPRVRPSGAASHLDLVQHPGAPQSSHGGYFRDKLPPHPFPRSVYR